MARGSSDKAAEVADKLAEKAARKAEKLHAKAEKLHTTVDKLAAKAERLQEWADRLEAIELWRRETPGRRQARFTRRDLARAAVALVDAEGAEALSMRRLAQELGAGTMTLYHYVRNKDELLALVGDEVMAEVLVPDVTALPEDWVEAMVVIATRTRDAMRRHPWMFELNLDPGFGPSSVRHIDQTLFALRSLDADLDVKVDVVLAVDEYVMGYCLQERGALGPGQPPMADLVAYATELVSAGGYPTLEGLLAGDGGGVAELWDAFVRIGADDARFERNLRRLLRGIAADLDR